MGMGCGLLGVRAIPGVLDASAEQWLLLTTALTFVGIGWGLSWTPVLPSMVEAAAERASMKTGEPVSATTVQVSAAVSALFNAAVSAGEGLGPTVGGAMFRRLGFDATVSVLGGMMCLTAVGTFCLAGGPQPAAAPPATPARAFSPPAQMHLRSAAVHAFEID